jgi:hypothetical protein
VNLTDPLGLLPCDPAPGSRICPYVSKDGTVQTPSPMGTLGAGASGYGNGGVRLVRHEGSSGAGADPGDIFVVASTWTWEWTPSTVYASVGAATPWTWADFVNHYYTGRGAAVDLGDVGLGGTFRYHPSVQNAVGGFVIDAMDHAPGTFSIFGTAVTDVTDTIFSVGHSTLYMGAQCTSASCLFNFGIRDSFRDVTGFGISAGGTPYRITYSWRETYTWPKIK